MYHVHSRRRCLSGELPGGKLGVVVSPAATYFGLQKPQEQRILMPGSLGAFRVVGGEHASCSAERTLPGNRLFLHRGVLIVDPNLSQLLTKQREGPRVTIHVSVSGGTLHR